MMIKDARHVKMDMFYRLDYVRSVERNLIHALNVILTDVKCVRKDSMLMETVNVLTVEVFSRVVWNVTLKNVAVARKNTSKKMKNANSVVKPSTIVIPVWTEIHANPANRPFT